MKVRKAQCLPVFLIILLSLGLQEAYCVEAKGEKVESIIEQLKNQYYAIVDFDLTQKEAQDSVEAFTGFLELPEALKETINHRVYSNFTLKSD
ncbi:MAG: hypothetical protein GY915_07870 [bacterium]|nr:hypothetical protein [bacterium]